MAGDADASSGHLGAGAGKTRGGQLRGQAEQVGESGGEAEEGDEILVLRMELDDLGNGESMGFGDEGKVGTVVVDGDVDAAADGDEVGDRLGADKGFHLGVGDGERVEVDEQGGVGGMEVHQPRRVRLVQEAEERNDLPIELDRDVVAEANEERAVAGGETFHRI